MLKSLTLENFKSWERIDAMRLAPITGLFGTNSSGKSSILQWLLLLKQTAESSDRRQVLNLGDDKSLVQLGTFHDVVFQHDQKKHIGCELEWSLEKALEIKDPDNPRKPLFKGKGLEFACELRADAGRKLFVDGLTYGFANHRFTYRRRSDEKGYALEDAGDPSEDFGFKRRPGRKWELPAPVKCYGFPDQVDAYHQNAGFLKDFQLAFEEMLARVFYLGPLRQYPLRQYTWSGAQPSDMGQRGERVVDAILASRDRGQKISRGKGKPSLTLEEYVADWLKKLELIHDFQVRPIVEGGNFYQVEVRKTVDAKPVLISDVGFGISQILPIIALCYYVPEGSTILLEQPEIHLHPSVQSGLADVFIDACRVRKVQIIVESHSEHLLKRLQRRIAEEETLRREDVALHEDVALYFCSFVKGRSKLEELEIDAYGDITNWPTDFFGDELGERVAMLEAGMKRRKVGA